MDTTNQKTQKHALRLLLLFLVVTVMTGCGYVKNRRDDLLDIGTLSAGVVPPVAPGESQSHAIGPIPPSFGLYLQATDYFHLGGLYKATGDIEWDRRGYGLTSDFRRKIGFGPFHEVYIHQKPYFVNAYKHPNSSLSGWREHMANLSDPFTAAPAKQIIFQPEEPVPESSFGNITGKKSLAFYHNGWQNWEMFSVELALPEPFLLHSGFYVRAGFDPSEVFDFVLGFLMIDLYDDGAYEFNGNLEHPPDTPSSINH